MEHGALYIFFLAMAALVSVAMWLDYFRQIDVFEKEKIQPLLIALLVGGFTPYLSLTLYGLFDQMGFKENGEFINDAMYAVFGIGLNEELCKLIGVIVAFKILKKQINEPIDVLIYAGATALGFSLVENYNYFYNHGIKIITSRTFYSALEHIINTSIIVYGYYRLKLFNKGLQFLNTLTGLIIAVASHGLFDFFLTETFLGPFTPYLSVLIYLIGINFWIQMLNNANNFSSYFDYHKINFSPRLVYRLFYWYALTVVITFINNTMLAGITFSFLTFLYGLLSDGFLFWVVILRVSRFKIFKMKYFKVVPALPFYITKNGDEDFRVPLLNIPVKVRGENYQEHLPTKYLNKKVLLYPVNEKRSFIKTFTEAEISDKYLLYDDVVVYSVTLEGFQKEEDTLFVLKPKTSGTKQMAHVYPIEGLYRMKLGVNPKDSVVIRPIGLELLEWVYFKPSDVY